MRTKIPGRELTFVCDVSQSYVRKHDPVPYVNRSEGML